MKRMDKMATELNSEKLIAQYLLGELPEEQQVEIEDRAFQDQEYLASITAVENDLIDEYVRNEMPETTRRRFEERFLASAERRKRVEFARALTKVSSEYAFTNRSVPAPVAISWRDSLETFFRSLNPVAKFALAAVVLLIIVGGAWLVTETLRLRSQLTTLQAENQSRQSLEQQMELQRRRNEELTARLNQEKQQREQSDESLRQLSETANVNTPAPRPVIASLTLLPGISRGAGARPSLVMSADARLVRLQIGIDPEDQYKTFAVDLRTVAGRPVWTRENLAARNPRGARSIVLTVPASALKPGEYELKLTGVTEGGATEDVGFYYFDVRKR